MKKVRTNEELKTLLQSANKIFEKGVMDCKSLTKLTIARCPDILKTFLFQISITSDDWTDFFRAADDSAWLCFTDNDETAALNSANVVRGYEKKMEKQDKTGAESKEG